MIIGFGFAFAMAIASIHAFAQNGERSGKAVVDATCAKCHATGANGAPKIGDKAAWSKLEEVLAEKKLEKALRDIYDDDL